jgi:hypothetical protein
MRVGFEQHGRREQNIVKSNDALFARSTSLTKRRPAVQREIQRVVQSDEVRAGADKEVDEPALHHLDDAAAETAGVRAPAIVNAIVVSCSGSSILSAKMRHTSPSAAVERLNPSSIGW